MSGIVSHLAAFMIGGACGVFTLAIVIAGGGHDEWQAFALST